MKRKTPVEYPVMLRISSSYLMILWFLYVFIVMWKTLLNLNLNSGLGLAFFPMHLSKNWVQYLLNPSNHRRLVQAPRPVRNPCHVWPAESPGSSNWCQSTFLNQRGNTMAFFEKYSVYHMFIPDLGVSEVDWAVAKSLYHFIINQLFTGLPTSWILKIPTMSTNGGFEHCSNVHLENHQPGHDT